MTEWQETKRLGFALQYEEVEDWEAATWLQHQKEKREKATQSKREAEPHDISKDVLEATGCPFKCELPLRHSLPCRHWMLLSFKEKQPLPLSLFHPR